MKEGNMFGMRENLLCGRSQCGVGIEKKINKEMTRKDIQGLISAVYPVTEFKLQEIVLWTQCIQIFVEE